MALFRSKQAVCPYCYRRIESDKAAFRCNGHAAAGKPRCVARPDPERKQVLGVDEAVLPTWPDKRSLLQRHRPFICPDCLGPTTRVCPVCHTPWPSTFTADSPLIGLVGVRGSGKTIMLSVLAQELTTSIQRRFDAAIHPTGNRRLVSQLANWRSDMGRGGHLPSQTETYQHVSKDQRDSAEPAVFEWQLADGRNRQRSTIFSFYDTAGEDLASMDRTRELNYLAATDGVILLLDPFGFTGNHDLARSKGVDEDLLHDRPEDVLRNIVELLRQADPDAALPEEAVHALDRVHSESLRMTRLVEDLLLLARLDAGRELQHDEVDLVGILLDTVSDARAAGPDHVWELNLTALDAPADLSQDELEDFEPEPPLVLGDEARLRQVLVNLLANARVHTPAGSHVSVTLTRSPAASIEGTDTPRRLPDGSGAVESHEARSSAQPGGADSQPARGAEELVITIADDGPGIAPEMRDRMFERFARGDASRERRTGSTGLGMSIALAIVQSHGGTLTVDSRQAPDDSPEDTPHGTTFTVRLPAAVGVE